MPICNLLQAIKNLFIGLETVIMKMMTTIMWAAPFGIMCLIAGNILEVKNLGDQLKALGVYVASAMVLLIFHFFIGKNLHPQ